jgi:hypothetical protein
VIALDYAQGIAEFFGCYLHHVNRILLTIGMNENRPEWLRLRPKLPDLPRWDMNATHLSRLSKRIKVPEIGERIIWVVEELQCGWTLTTEGFVFEDVRESLYFKLRWG